MKVSIQTAILIFFFNICGWSQQLVLKGIIKDSETNEPIPFATVAIHETMLGTATNAEGEFAFNIPEAYRNGELVVSHLGYALFRLQISGIKSPVTILLERQSIKLDNVVISPWTAWDYISNAVRHIEDNYSQKPYNSTAYYNEFISENDVYIKFTEGVVLTYHPAYGDTAENHSKVLQARTRDDVGKIQFMRDKIEKKLTKEQKKAIRKGEDYEVKSIDEEILSVTLGGPRQILKADILRDTSLIMNKDIQKKFVFEIAGYTRYYDQDVIIIGFKSKRKFEHQYISGSVYISLESDAIMATEMNSEVVIPTVAKPIMAVLGIGVENPILKVDAHYRPYMGRWFVNDVSMEMKTVVTKRRIFSKDDKANFKVEQTLITTDIETENVKVIPKEERLDTNKPLEQQVTEDKQFWDQYNVARPGRLTK